MSHSDIAAAIKALSEQRTSIARSIATAVSALSESVRLNPQILCSISSIAENVRTWPEWQRENWRKAADMGWYFNWETPISSSNEAVEAGKDALNQFMTTQIENDWDKLTEIIKKLCPERAPILDEAFALHKEQRFIASIPLFLSQIDGICAQYLGSFLFSDHEKRTENIQNILSESSDAFLKLTLSSLSEKNPYGERISKNSKKNKERGPNRNGILHGSRKHLDYGTKTNSLKCFSLLCFVVFTLVDTNAIFKT